MKLNGVIDAQTYYGFLFSDDRFLYGEYNRWDSFEHSTDEISPEHALERGTVGVLESALQMVSRKQAETILQYFHDQGYSDVRLVKIQYFISNDFSWKLEDDKTVYLLQERLLGLPDANGKYHAYGHSEAGTTDFRRVSRYKEDQPLHEDLAKYRVRLITVVTPI